MVSVLEIREIYPRVSGYFPPGDLRRITQASHSADCPWPVGLDPDMAGNEVLSSPYERLEVWRLAHELALAIYRETENFPRREHFGLAAQLRRAAASIPANLAEGTGRGSSREDAYFCRVAKGSVLEVRYYLRLARDLGHISQAVFDRLMIGYDRVGKMLHFLIRSLRDGSSCDILGGKQAP